MRILSIRGKNLASLGEEFELDFTSEPLRSAGLYAITGPTGSGKSTILDAVCLALFGRVPRLQGLERKDNKVLDISGDALSVNDPRGILRKGAGSGFAEVRFEAEGRTEYVARWEVRRANGRADGRLQAVDWSVHDDTHGQNYAQGIAECQHKISELLGMTAEQFLNLVLLAQGKFAEFLKSSSREKSSLLEKITGAEIYCEIGKAIYARAQAANEAIAQKRVVLDSVHCLGEEERGALEAKLVTLMDLEAQRAKDCRDLEGQLQWLGELGKLLASLAEAEEEMERQQAQRPTWDKQRRGCESWDRAQEIAPAIEAANRAKAKRDAGRAQADAWAKTQLQCARQLEAEGAKREAIDREIAQAKVEAQERAKIRVKVEGLLEQWDVLVKELDTAHAQTAEQKKLWDEGLRSLSELQKSLQQKETELRRAHAAQEALAGLRTIWESEAEWRDCVRRYPNTQQQVSRLENSVARLRKGLRVQQEMFTEYEARQQTLEASVSSEVLELRSRLEVGAPCPVCGQAVHELGQHAETSGVNMQELQRERDEIREAIRRLQGEQQEMATELGKQETLLEAQEKELRGLLETVTPFFQDLVEDFAQLLAQPDTYSLYTKKARQWREGGETIRVLEGEKKPLEATIEGKRGEVELLQRQYDDRRAVEEAISTKQQGLKQAVQELLRIPGATIRREDVVYRLEAMQTEASAREARAENALRAYLNALEQLGREKTTLDTKIAQEQGNQRELEGEIQGFLESVQAWLDSHPDVPNYEALIKVLGVSKGQVDAVRGRIEIADKEFAKVCATREERAKQVEGKRGENPKLAMAVREEVERQLRGAEGQLAECRKALEDVKLRVETDRQKGRERKRLEEELKALREKGAPAQKLSALLGDSNGTKFQKLAMKRTLRNLVTFANDRLAIIMPRYRLEVDDLSDGLRITVVDTEMADTKRPVESLSGGETFIVSLAFSLALSELATRSSRRMDMLFIDEGFGTLDSESLNMVSEALNGLQRSGRKVGFISHVTQLTETIPVRVEVNKGAAGASKVRVVG